MNDLKGKKVGVLGLGEENIALTSFLIDRGANVVICDQKTKEELGEYYQKVKDLPVQFRLGSHYLDNLGDFSIVFRTPGIPYLNPKIQKAKILGVEISSEIKLFMSLCPSITIGVTGTKGKGTTSTLIYEILKKYIATCPKAGRPRLNNLYLAGNIGHPPINFLNKLKPEDIVILELSSFQLQDLYQSPHIAVVLDIKVDHLDYHQNEEEYVAAKTNIVKFQTKKDFTIINADYLTSFEFALQSAGEAYWFSRRKSVDQGAWVKEKKEIIWRYHNKDYPIVETSKISLRGEHNWENICAAITASFLAGADLESIREVVKWFPGLEHRLEFVAQIEGVKYYNDSFSTTPDTAIAAIKAFLEPIVLISGGSEKGADYSELGKTIDDSTVKTVVLIGKTGPKIGRKIKSKKIKKILDCKDINEAVNRANQESQSGGVVLLSPASASFDWFKNYKERGQKFKEAVRNKAGYL